MKTKKSSGRRAAGNIGLLIPMYVFTVLFVACMAACFGWLPRSIWVVTFSNTTIASSTTMPIAIESELNEIMFNVLPEASK